MSDETGLGLSDGLLDRYLANRATHEEHTRVERLLWVAPEVRRALSRLRGIWFLPREADRTGPEDERVRALIAERLGGCFPGETNPLVQNTSTAQRRGTSTVRPMARVLRATHQQARRMPTWAAAGIAIVGLLAIGGMMQSEYVASHKATANVAVRELSTRSGQQMTLELPDGSVVTLAPESRLRIPEVFSDGARTVELAGEALFDIAPGTEAPFVVRTDKSVIRVLGTRFNVRAYDSNTTVAVVTGKVSVGTDRAGAPGIVIPAGHIGSLRADGEAHVWQASMDQHVAWVDGRLVFRGTPLPEVLDRLQRWFGVPFTADSSLLHRHLTADWKDRSLEYVLQSLGIALDADVTREDTGVTLYAR